MWKQGGGGGAQNESGERGFGAGRGRTGINHLSTVFMGVDNGVDNGSPPRLLDGHRVFEGGQLGGQ